jgi:KUP system potassium uptake protein
MNVEPLAKTTAEPVAQAPAVPATPSRRRSFWGLVLGSIGVVFGDIGTSPLYALRESLRHAATGGLQRSEVLGVVSLILWSIFLIVTLKYVIFLMRADNKGEGGTLSLLALTVTAVGRRTPLLFVLGIMAAALFFGDALITPAISVLSAIEGLKQVTPVFDPYIVPITIVILVGLFSAQAMGTGSVAALFGPITLVWFLVLGALGIWHLGDDLAIIGAILPTYGIQFLLFHGQVGFLVLGAVFLAVTGAEALYADMGHFGRGPIRTGWMGLVLPCLVLNYLGQGAMVLAHPETAVDPFFLSCPKPLLLPIVMLATAATVIASQAVITGAFSLTQQAIQLGLLPRLEIRHTSDTLRGQIFLPRINTMLLLGVVALVVMFHSSSNLASAYGIAVTGTMVVDTVLAYIFVRRAWGWKLPLSLAVIVPLLIAETAFFLANLMKVASGGWVPLLISGLLMLCMWTWVRGTSIIFAKSRRESVPLNDITTILARRPPTRVPGTAVFLTADPDTAPPALMHNLKHNKVLHQRNVVLCVENASSPRVLNDQRVSVEFLTDDFVRVRVRYGYMETPDIPEALNLCRAHGLSFEIMSTSFFLARRNLRASKGSDMPAWQDKLYIALSKQAASATDFFRIPPGRVVELGQQIVV